MKKQFTEGDPRGRLSIDRNECDVGEKVEVEAYCLDPDGFPLHGARVRLRIEREGGEVQHLAMQPAPGGWGIYRASYTPGRPGKYRMQPIISTYGDEPLSSSVALQVARVDLERNFLVTYIEEGILPENPFQTVDTEGVGRLMRMSVEEGRKSRPDLEVGICGEHGGDPASIEFCHTIGQNYVSCSPFRVPVARLAAAHAALKYAPE